ncbi:MAG: TRAP transporter small permease subunit [Rhodospirillales bacterium]|nr:TRAP transporter small permease subunit [Rhodospirillales bacterium]
MTETLEKIARGLEKLTGKIAMVGAWVAVLLVFLIIFDVVGRRFFNIGSSKLQELEWHLHTIVFMFCLGWGYFAGAHVRIGVIWEKFSPRTQLWIEIIGCLFFLFPFVAILIFFGWQLMADSFAKGEISAATTGLSYRWAIKATIPFGSILLLLAGIGVFCRTIANLRKMGNQ